jgi:hypothetical protein
MLRRSLLMTYSLLVGAVCAGMGPGSIVEGRIGFWASAPGNSAVPESFVSRTGAAQYAQTASVRSGGGVLGGSKGEAWVFVKQGQTSPTESFVRVIGAAAHDGGSGFTSASTLDPAGQGAARGVRFRLQSPSSFEVKSTSIMRTVVASGAAADQPFVNSVRLYRVDQTGSRVAIPAQAGSRGTLQPGEYEIDVVAFAGQISGRLLTPAGPSDAHWHGLASDGFPAEVAEFAAGDIGVSGFPAPTVRGETPAFRTATGAKAFELSSQVRRGGGSTGGGTDPAWMLMQIVPSASASELRFRGDATHSNSIGFTAASTFETVEGTVGPIVLKLHQRAAFSMQSESSLTLESQGQAQTRDIAPPVQMYRRIDGQTRSLIQLESVAGSVLEPGEYELEAVVRAGEIPTQALYPDGPTLATMYGLPDEDLADAVVTRTTADWTLRLTDPRRETALLTRVLSSSIDWTLSLSAQPQTATERFGASTDKPVRLSSSDGGRLTAIAVSDGGTPVVFERKTEDGDWIAFDPREGLAVSSDASDTISWTDPSSGHTMLLAVLPTTTLLFDVDVGSALDFHGEDGDFTRIAERPVVLVTSDTNPVVVLSGLSDAGDLVLFSRRASDPEHQWTFRNLSGTDFRGRGIPEPVLTSNLVLYATPWGGLNLAGVDATGSVRAVWWAPGQEFWNQSNLSETSGAPPIQGDLCAYVQPWGGMNLVGIGADGKPVIIWWTPGFGSSWRVNSLAQSAGAQELTPGSLAVYTTPWGGANIIGKGARDAGVYAYWWAPGVDDWSTSALLRGEAGEQAPGRGPLSGLASPEGELSVAYTNALGEIVRLYWSPGSNGWSAENLSRAANVRDRQ